MQKAIGKHISVPVLKCPAAQLPYAIKLYLQHTLPIVSNYTYIIVLHLYLTKHASLQFC